MDAVKKIQQFISYWYVRYLLATELYMVEPWERVVVHILLSVMFCLFFAFNYSVMTCCFFHARRSYDVEQLL